MLPGKERTPEVGKRGGKVARHGVAVLEEGPQTAPPAIDAAQGQHEVAQVAAPKRAVDKGVEANEFALRGVAHEVRRGVVHQAHHPVAVADDRLAVAPGDRRGEEAGDLTVGTVRKAMRDRNRIVGDELRAVVGVVEPLEQFAQFGISGPFHPTS